MSRLEVDSLEQNYGRKVEVVSVGKPPAPPPPTTSPPPPPPPSPPPPPPKKYHLMVPKRHVKLKDFGNQHRVGKQSSWSVTSGMYWKILVALQLILSVTDVVDSSNNTLMYYQRIYFIFMFSVAILVIMSLYIHTVHSKCPGSGRQQSSNEDGSSTITQVMADEERFSTSIGSLHGTLKRAYFRRQTLTTTNFHMRLGAVVFGIASLIYFGFEIAVHTTGGQACVDDLVFALPIVLVVLCFFQIHFLFVNSQVSVGCFRGPAQFCFAHLLATNIALFLKTVGYQSATNWVVFLNGLQASNNTSENFQEDKIEVDIPTVGGLWWTTLLPAEFERIAVLTNCIHNATLGQMWIQATPFLIPFLLQFCIVSASVFYVSWRGKQDTITLPSHSSMSTNPRQLNDNNDVIYCHLGNRGIFIGLLLLVGGVVVLVMYLILRGQPQFNHDSVWVINGTLCLILAVAIMSTLAGFLKLQGTPYLRMPPSLSALDDYLTSITTIGPLLYSLLGVIVSASHISTNAHLLVLAHSGLLLIQVTLQNVYMSEKRRRVQSRTGNQMLQMLLFANASLWLLDTFMTASGDSQVLQESFYGPLLWGVLSLTSTPLMALYRFHSSIQLYELWKRSYT
ncbi:hypothetical protein CHUAL_003535 [Chamberlinius hualienensis]